MHNLCHGNMTDLVQPAAAKGQQVQIQLHLSTHLHMHYWPGTVAVFSGANDF